MTPQDSEIVDLLATISTLLLKHDASDWSSVFDHLRLEFLQSPDAAKDKIRSLYGGMGSFSDIVLHSKERVPLREVNDQLDEMRSRLFRLCQHK